MPENLDQVIEIIKKYRCSGLLKGGEFLLPPQEAALLVEDLAAAGVLVVGCELCKYVDRQKGWIIEIPGAGGVIDKRMTLTDVRRNADVLKGFLTKELPDDIDLITLIYGEGEMWDLFRKHGKCEKSE